MTKNNEIKFIQVLDFEGLYEVSECGIVKSLGIEKIAKNGMRTFKPEKILKHRIDKDGYVIYTLYLNGKRVDKKAHRIVLASFTGEWKKETVNHKDGNKQNNHRSNLEWNTVLENNRHALKTGLRKPKYGLESPRALPEEKVNKIKNLLEEGVLSVKEISIKVEISTTSIRRIKNMKTYV